MKAVKLLFCCHVAALLFGLGGLVIALPHPELWNHTAYGAHVFSFGMSYAGSLHILFGAATMLLFGLLSLGVRKTLIFFAASTLISLSMELMGTSTGFPFGPYAYGDFLGIKILGYVPYAIPLSWFYMGFTSYLLASLLVERTRWSHKTLWTLLLATYFLTVWDLSLDPAMANAQLPVHFWMWYESGPYFGMPVRNLVGWSITGLLYMGVSRFFWREDLDRHSIVAWLPFGVYMANTCFAIGLNLDAGLWLPPLIGLILGLLPASLVLVTPRSREPKMPVQDKTPQVVRRMAFFSLRKGSQTLLKRHVDFTVEGVQHLPSTGATLIVARHAHNLYDGCALLSVIPRPLHILVAPDWIKRRWLRSLMEYACRMVTWPIVLRAERLALQASTRGGAYSLSEVPGYLFHAFRGAVELLRRGEVLVVFPEAYPLVDPCSTPQRDDEGFLPFRAGFARIVEATERDKRTCVAIIPAGFFCARQKRWQIILRFGPPLFRQDFPTRALLLQAVERRVRELSVPATLSPLRAQGAIEL